MLSFITMHARAMPVPTGWLFVTCQGTMPNTQIQGLLIQVEIQTFRQLQPELRIKFLLSWCLVAFGRIISTLPPNGIHGLSPSFRDN